MPADRQAKGRQAKTKPKRPSLTQSDAVPMPLINQYHKDIIQTKTIRSSQVRLEKTIALAEMRARRFVEFAPKFRTEFTEAEMLEAEKPAMAAICDELRSDKIRALSFSAQIFDKDDKALFYYVADRKHLGTAPPIQKWTRRNALKYQNQIDRASRTTFDGLNADIIHRTHQATQCLSSALQPKLNESDSRHQVDSGELDPRVMTYQKLGEPQKERCGQYHLVHGWPQQAQASKGLFLSSEHSKSGTGMAAIKNYFLATSVLARTLSAWFKVLYPEEYADFETAFEAGVWVEEDPGPWLGRAIVYKLQVALHLDQGDDGPAVSFPVGFFDGGEMLIPGLQAKFSYRPGHMCFFRASRIYHAVTQWTPHEMKTGDELTPGRIGHVFFSPQASLEQLKDKGEGWAKRTAMGRAPDPSYD